MWLGKQRVKRFAFSKPVLSSTPIKTPEEGKKKKLELKRKHSKERKVRNFKSCGFYTHQMPFKISWVMYALNIYFYNTVNSHYFCWVICAHERKSGNPDRHLTWTSSTTKFVKCFTLKNVQGSLTEILTDSCTLFICTAGQFPVHMQTKIKPLLNSMV